MRRWAWCVVLMGCGAAPIPWPEGRDPAVLPLAESWRPGRLLIEARLDGAGPLLFVVDPAVPEMRLASEIAVELALRGRGDPNRGRRVEAALSLGSVDLPAVVFRVMDQGPAPLGGRRVAGVLGAPLLAGRRLHVDAGRGLLRFERTPSTAIGVELSRVAGGWTAPVELAGGTRDMLLSTAAPSAVLRSVAEEGGLAFESGEGLRRSSAVVGYQGPFAVDALRRVHRFAALERAPSGVEGVLGVDALAGHDLYIDLPAERLAVRSAVPDPARLRRFPDLPDCGPAFGRCVRGVVVERTADRARIRFGPPQVPLPQRYWVRIRVGEETALVQFGPSARSVPEAALDRVSGRFSAVGTAVEVVDVLPLARGCHGAVCLR